jgi:hypothetical protein
MAKNLTDRVAFNAVRKSTPYRFAAAASLFLEVRLSGEKIWRYRYRSTVSRISSL